ncbi:MAG: N-acetylmuramoyl-L-alanine amidase [Deltaproteobacteria bacterium]
MRRLWPGLVLALLPSAAFAQTICVDPGHGGADPGAVGCGYEEEDIVIDVSLRLRTLLQGAGFTVLMTRTNDSAVSLSARSSMANSAGASRFMSIHANSAGVVATGIETFCSNNASANAVDLRDEIQSEMIATWPLANRGGKRANFSVLTNTNMPATLSELGFINNCNVDVSYLSNPNERQRAAQAHLNALLRHLGQNPMPTTGVLTGVVFEDTGAGLADTSIRIPGAAVTIQETGASDSASADSGAWRFDLPPGTYTVRAEQSGYGVTARTCTVQSGDTTWCSVGLFAEGMERDGGVVTPDAGHADAGHVDSGVKTPRDGGVEDSGVRIGVGGETRDGGEPVTLVAQDVDSGCGCSAAESRGFTWWALLPFLVLLRRRSLWLLVLLIPATASAEPSVGDARIVARGRYVAPVIAPDGAHVLVTTAARDGVVVLGVDEPIERRVVEQAGAGYRPVWSDARRFGVRSAARPCSGAPLMQFDRLGGYHGPQPLPARVAQVDARVHVNGKPIHEGEPSFAPALSPDGAFVAYETPTGLFLHRVADGRRFALGRGSAPSFSGDAKVLVFERTTDDGHTLKTSGLYFVRLGEAAKVERLLDEAGLELSPSLSRGEGGVYRLAYQHDDRIVVRTVRF